MSQFNKGTRALEKGKYLKALSHFKKQEGEFKELYLNIGNCYRWLGKDSLALDNYILANSKSVPFIDGKYGEYVLALNNIGLLEYAAGNDENAIAFYKYALTLSPLNYESIWNMSIATLRNDIYSAIGWKMYEYRFNRGSGSVRTDKSLERWDEKSSGDSICVLTEQGIGDKIMFGRYIHKLSEFFSEITVVCHPSLDVFFSQWKIARVGSGLAVDLCSLARIFGVDCSANWLPYKYSLPSSFRVGVVWCGSVTHANNHNRSCSKHYFDFIDHVSLVPERSSLDLSTWEKTISVLLGLSLVISVDTSIVHLCGTLGIPCIMVQPLKDHDFRWGNTYRGDVQKWYPSVTVVHNNNNWDEAFATVRELVSSLEIKCIKA